MVSPKTLRDDPTIDGLLKRAIAPKQDELQPDHVQPREGEKIDGMLQHFTAVQHNILPLDQIRNGASVDGAIWLGFEKPTRVQQAGLLLFGSTFVMGGIATILRMHERGLGFTLFDVVGLGSVSIGLKIASNAFRRRKHKVANEDS